MIGVGVGTVVCLVIVDVVVVTFDVLLVTNVIIVDTVVQVYGFVSGFVVGGATSKPQSPLTSMLMSQFSDIWCSRSLPLSFTGRGGS